MAQCFLRRPAGSGGVSTFVRRYDEGPISALPKWISARRTALPSVGQMVPMSTFDFSSPVTAWFLGTHDGCQTGPSVRQPSLPLHGPQRRRYLCHAQPISFACSAPAWSAWLSPPPRPARRSPRPPTIPHQPPQHHHHCPPRPGQPGQQAHRLDPVDRLRPGRRLRPALRQRPARAAPRPRARRRSRSHIRGSPAPCRRRRSSPSRG